MSIVLPATRQFTRGLAVKMLVVGTPMACDVTSGQSATLTVFPASGSTSPQSHSPTHISMFPVQLTRLHEVSLSLLDIDQQPIQFSPTAPPFVVTLVFASDVLW